VKFSASSAAAAGLEAEIHLAPDGVGEYRHRFDET
jgi:hypothetical protein